LWAALLSISLVPAPVPTHPEVLGVVTQASDASLGTGMASIGASVYDGDSLSTQSDGAITILGGPTMLYLARQSQMAVHALAGIVGGREAQLAAGTLVFTTSRSGMLEILADNARIRPRTDSPTVGQITVIDSKTLYIYARQGSLSLSYEDEKDVIPEGKSYRVMLDPPDDSPAANKSVDPDPHNRPHGRHRAFLLILLGVGAAVGSVIRKLDEMESPDHP